MVAPARGCWFEPQLAARHCWSIPNGLRSCSAVPADADEDGGRVGLALVGADTSGAPLRECGICHHLSNRQLADWLNENGIRTNAKYVERFRAAHEDMRPAG